MAATAEPIEQIKQRIELISREQAREEIASGEAKLIDVREPHEWNEAHLAEATHVPQGELLERIDELVPDTSERVLLYCRTDNRSSRAADALRSLGYDNVGVIERGIVGWTEEDLPVVSESGLSPDSETSGRPSSAQPTIPLSITPTLSYPRLRRASAARDERLSVRQ